MVGWPSVIGVVGWPSVIEVVGWPLVIGVVGWPSVIEVVGWPLVIGVVGWPSVIRVPGLAERLRISSHSTVVSESDAEAVASSPILQVLDWDPRSDIDGPSCPSNIG